MVAISSGRVSDITIWVKSGNDQYMLSFRTRKQKHLNLVHMSIGALKTLLPSSLTRLKSLI